MQYPGRCVSELLDGVRFFYGVELSSSLCTICGARDPSPLIDYVHANTIPTLRFDDSIDAKDKIVKRESRTWPESLQQRADIDFENSFQLSLDLRLLMSDLPLGPL